MTATILEFKRPNNDGKDEGDPADHALCCEECGSITWALLGDGKAECLHCSSVLAYARWVYEAPK